MRVTHRGQRVNPISIFQVVKGNPKKLTASPTVHGIERVPAAQGQK